MQSCFLKENNMKFIDLKKHLNTREYKSCYLIMGEDAGVRAIAKRLLLRVVDGFEDMNVTYFDNRSTASQIVSACNSMPFLANYRLVVVRDFNQSTQEIATYLANPNPSTVLVFDCETNGQNLKPLLKYAEIVDCGRLDKSFLVRYCALIAKENGVGITVKATELLIDYCNSFLGRIETEIKKLSSDSDVINESMVIEKVNPDHEVVVFGLMDIMHTGNKNKAMEYLDDLLIEGQSPFALLGALYAGYRKLFYASINKNSDTLAADLGIKEYMLKFINANAAHYTPVSLKKICSAIADAEYAVKSGKMSDKTALYTTVAQVMEHVKSSRP